MPIVWEEDPRADGQWAADELRRWLEAGGFGPLQSEPKGDGYFTTKAQVAWRCRARVHYRGGGLGTVRRMLEAVAERLDKLGAGYDVEQRNVEMAVYYPALVVEVNERLWQTGATDDLPASEPPA